MSTKDEKVAVARERLALKRKDQDTIVKQVEADVSVNAGKQGSPEVQPKPRTKRTTDNAVAPPVVNPGNLEGAVYFVYFMHRKGASGDKDTGRTPFKIGVSNNVKEAREKLEEGSETDLKTHRIIKCNKGDAAKLLTSITKKFETYALQRNWYKVSKEAIDQCVADIIKNMEYSVVTESMARVGGRTRMINK
jgi:hypothetical protein